MNGAAALFTNFGFSIKKILAIIIATLLLILMFPILAISSLGLPAMSFLANAPSAKAAEERGFYNGGVMLGNTYTWGNCTWWAYAMRRWANSPIPNTWGNANTWDDNAKRDGYIVNDTPAAGAVFQTDEGPYGHVAYVIEVNQTSGCLSVWVKLSPIFIVFLAREFSMSLAPRLKVKLPTDLRMPASNE